MIKCISVDGLDGSGKTTIIDKLKENYNVALLPRFYGLAMVPMDPVERKNWFRSHNSVDTIKIYLAAHRTRILCARDYKAGLHYAFIEEEHKPNLVILDRGILSVEAFAYAALRIDTEMTDNEIFQYIDEYFRNDYIEKMYETIDKSILLIDDREHYLPPILARRQYDKQDVDLIRYQAQYYALNHYLDKNVVKISPLNSKEENYKKVVEVISSL